MPVHILMIGPLSGPSGGATVLFRQLVEQMRARSDIAVMVVDTSNTGSTTRLSRLLSIAVQTIKLIWQSDVVSLHVSSMQAAFYSALLWLLCAVTGRMWALRIFGDASVKHRAMHPVRRWLLDRLLRQCPLLLVETRMAAEYFAVRCRRVEWYPNNRPVRSGKGKLGASGCVRFVFVGDVKPSKGVCDIFKAVRLLGSCVRVDVYGRMQSGISFKELNGMVRYRGELRSSDVSAVLSQYDVLLLPTHYSGEGYPGVVLEAFAAGLAVIATRWQAIPEVVNETNGILIEPRDPFHLAAAMQYLIQTPAELKRLRAGARYSARQFDSETWARRFVQILGVNTPAARCEPVPNSAM